MRIWSRMNGKFIKNCWGKWASNPNSSWLMVSHFTRDIVAFKCWALWSFLSVGKGGCRVSPSLSITCQTYLSWDLKCRRLSQTRRSFGHFVAVPSSPSIIPQPTAWLRARVSVHLSFIRYISKIIKPTSMTPTIAPSFSGHIQTCAVYFRRIKSTEDIEVLSYLCADYHCFTQQF